MNWLLDAMFGDRLARETSSYLGRLASAPQQAVRRNSTDMLNGFERSAKEKVNLGLTPWLAPVNVPLEEIVRAHGLVTGGTGSGKSMFASLIIKTLIEQPFANYGFGVLDAKGELFLGALWLLAERLN